MCWVCNNKVYNNKFGITIGCENQINAGNATSMGIHVRNNFIYNNALAGIVFGSNGVNNGSVQGNVTYGSITGNTLVKNSSSNQWGSEIIFQNANNIDCFNNIVYGRYMQMFTLATGVSALNCRANRYFNNTSTSFYVSQQTSSGSWTSLDLTTFKGMTNDSGSDQSTFSDPAIVSALETNPDPHLQSTSSCINAGKTGFTPFSGETDYDGQARIIGSKVDIGVDETGAGNACPVINIDNNLNDWNNINAVATATNQTALSLKAANDNQTLFFAISGSGMDNNQYQIFINSDNNTSTGYQDSQYTSSGADYLIENGILYRYYGTGWSWTAVNASITATKNSSIVEVSINRSAFTTLSGVITVSYKDMSNWVTQSRLPASSGYAAYTINICQ